jgi:hypothetical protein
MNLPDFLKPTAVERFQLLGDGIIDVKKATLQFAPWRGPAISSTYGGKAVVDFRGRPAFAELAVLWGLIDTGWQGCWVTHGRTRHIYRTGLMHEKPVGSLPDPLEQVLRETRRVLGTGAGVWDVAVKNGDDLLFVECKRLRRDAIRAEQVTWLDAALRMGVPREFFLVAEWDVEAVATDRAAPTLAPEAAHAPVDTRRPIIAAADAGSAPITGVVEPTRDVEYYRWLQLNPSGFVLSVSGRRQPKLHNTGCGNIRTHNNPGAMTERGSRKICSLSKSALRDWLGANGYSQIPDKCGTCGA